MGGRANGPELTLRLSPGSTVKWLAYQMGNPRLYLMVVSPLGREMFLVDVKGLHSPNPWVVKRKAVRANLFYVLAFVSLKVPNQYLLMTQHQASSSRLNSKD